MLDDATLAPDVSLSSLVVFRCRARKSLQNVFIRYLVLPLVHDPALHESRKSASRLLQALFPRRLVHTHLWPRNSDFIDMLNLQINLKYN